MADRPALERRDEGCSEIVAGDDAHGYKVANLSDLHADGDGTTEDAHVDYADGHLSTASADLEKDLVDPEDLFFNISVTATSLSTFPTNSAPTSLGVSEASMSSGIFSFLCP